MSLARTGRRSERPSTLHFGTVASPPSEVITRTMTDEERAQLDARLAGMKPRKLPKVAPSKPPEARQYPGEGTKVPKERDRNEYLALRAKDMTVEQIAEQWGIKAGTIRNYLLRKWGYHIPVDEIAAVEAYKRGETPAAPVNPAPQSLVAAVEQAVEDSGQLYVTLRIPIGEAPDPNEAYADLTRSQLMRLAGRIMRTAVSRTADDVRDIWGDDKVQEIVQVFAERNLA